MPYEFRHWNEGFRHAAPARPHAKPQNPEYHGGFIENRVDDTRVYGEGTEVGGDLYQISNNITLGISEEQTLDKIKPVVERIIELERAGREDIYKNSKDLITDKIKRSYGTIKNAHMIALPEFLSLYSMIRLGITYSVIKNIDYKTLDMLLVKVMPANLSLQFANSEDNRNVNKDILRAEYIQGVLG